jgi:DNA-binding response OmpR family regulator
MKRILIIEDDRDNASALGMRLKNEGYEIAVAYDAVSGLSTVSRFRPDLLLLDISMPGGGGLLVAERLRNMVATVTMPIIFVTGTKDPELRTKATALGAAGFIEKPYEPRHLLAAIGRLLGESPKSARRDPGPQKGRVSPDPGSYASDARRPRPRGRAGRE